MSRVTAQPLDKRRKDAHPSQARSRQEWVAIANLHGDPAYQRPIAHKRVTRMAEHFDPDAFGTVTLSLRADDTLWVLDGQHRIQCLKVMGWDDQKVPALVYSGLSHEEEARIFRLMNGEATAPRAFDLFRARLAEGEKVACEINMLVEQIGARLRLDTAPMGIACVSALEKVYKNSGYSKVVLDAALTVIRDAWRDNIDGTRQTIFVAEMVMSLGILINRYDGMIELKRLVQVLTRTEPQILLREARAAAQALSATNLAGNVLPMILVNRYNLRLAQAKQLPAWEQRLGATAWKPVKVSGKVVVS